MVFGPVKVLKKTFFGFFSSIYGDLVTVLKVNFEYLKKKQFNFAPLLSPQEIEEKNPKKGFFGICTGPNTLILDLKLFLAAYAPW
jgi:hypothetical protein